MSIPSSITVPGSVSHAAPPVTTAAVLPSPNPAGWNRTNITVTLSATDSSGGSGVSQIRYTIGTGSPVTAFGSTASFNLTTEGIYNVSYYAIDNAGNRETAHILSVKIDKTPPVTAILTSPSANPSGWNNTSVTLTLSATDSSGGSGVNQITYAIGTGIPDSFRKQGEF